MRKKNSGSIYMPDARASDAKKSNNVQRAKLWMNIEQACVREQEGERRADN